MRKNLCLLFVAVFMLGVLKSVYSQAKKMVFFEHFTNASCNPCAQANPVFDNNILKKNKGRVLHLAYHTNWPGTDPMNAHNPSEVQTRVTYYGVSGVPHVKMQGNKYGGSPTGVTNSMIDNEAMLPSPVRIKVKDMPNDGVTRNVEVVVYTVDTVPVSNYKLRTAVVEKEKTYATAPGSNGEKYFPNIFRKFLNNATGEDLTVPAIGDSAVFNFSYTLNTTVWDTTQIYVIAFVQNDANKNVLNAGSNLDPQWEFVPVSDIYQAGINNLPTDFTINLTNFADEADSFIVVMTHTQPTDWTAGFSIDTINYVDTAYIVAGAHSGLNVVLSVTPGASSGIGSYIFSIKSLTDTSLAAEVLQFFVSHNVTDLIVNNDGSWGSGGTTSAQDYEINYIKGLNEAGNTSFATISMQPFLTASKMGLLDSIDCIFYNASWAFPSLTNDNVAVFKSFLDNGGKMFVSGQDIGWETYESTSGTGQTKLFYSNYLGANYIADGSSSNNTLNIYTSDPIFGTLSSSPITDVYGGNMYPDVISAKPFSFPVFYYNTDSTKLACVRSNSTIFKSVYLSVSLEMIADSNVRKQIIHLSHDWFKGIISSTEFDKYAQEAILGQNYPNPAHNETYISINGNNSQGVIEFYDLSGRIITSVAVQPSSQYVKLNTTNFESGAYFYRFVSGGKSGKMMKMMVVR
ncbi:MAG: hypothetical protein BWY70_00282 [Bacteroidetes bacterium ADurb.Bin408]|nr:MAG: hypothetical protein BWY70_00282 [Bacteroidetes bacterium ADurb.Bin408]